ncbi:MAG: hypothetical protein ACKVS8_05925 [Phycisphaerales bacterium]
MNPAAVRSLLAEGGIGLAVCAGLLYGLVEPIERRTAAVRAAVAQVEAGPASGEAESPDGARAALAAAVAEAADVAATSAPAATQSDLFAAVMRLAETHRVRVEQLQPATMTGTVRAPPAAPPSPVVAAAAGVPSPALAPAKPETVLGCSLSVVSDFGSLVLFVDELQRQAGFGRVHTLRLSPMNEAGSRAVIAAVQSEHVSFDTSPVRAAAGLASAEKESRP